MSALIPTYHLDMFARQDGVATDVFCPQAHQARGKAALPITSPYRSDYFKISLCLRGTAGLNVNTTAYTVVPGSVVLVTPHIIKQWTHFSDDYETLSVFFSSDFLTTNNAQIGKLSFLRNPTTYVLPLAPSEADSMADTFRFLRQKYDTPHPQRRNIVKNILNGLLYELQTLFDQSPPDLTTDRTRNQALTAAFKQLMQVHSAQTRNVTFYADKLFVTPKHLTEMVREVTGKTASDLLAEAVVLEAKALLQTTALPMSQIADQLHFADQFAFSRFFKQRTGLSPTAYKRV